MKIHYMTCERCSRQLEEGDEAYYYKETRYCPTCFDIVMDEVRDEAIFTVSKEDCDDYDANKGCY